MEQATNVLFVKLEYQLSTISLIALMNVFCYFFFHMLFKSLGKTIRVSFSFRMILDLIELAMLLFMCESLHSYSGISQAD